MTPVVDVERLCLVAIHDPVDVDEIRRHWNMKETPILDGLVTTAPSLPLGPVDVPVPVEGNKGGPSGRVFSLLWLRGTIPEYVLPKLDDTLARELLECSSRWRKIHRLNTSAAMSLPRFSRGTAARE